MDHITQKYQQASQQAFDYINNTTAGFQKYCEDMKAQTEKKIAALDPKAPDYTNQENSLKLQLKQTLELELDKFEKVIKSNFRQNIVVLEDIYREKEISRLQEIEKLILSYK